MALLGASLAVRCLWVQNQNYSYATAIGLFGGIIGLILVSGSHAISKKLTDESLYLSLIHIY